MPSLVGGAVATPAQEDAVPELSVVPELCLIRPPARTARELLALMAQRAVAAGYAATTFEQALLAREATFPTGLPTPVPVAIPHTDVQHVIRPALAAALLDPPIPFGEMGGSPDSMIDVRVVIVLLVTEPSAQVTLLGQLVSVVQRPDLAEGLSEINDAGTLATVLNQLLGIAANTT
jgi:PTS system galactitol-specific IIA component